MEKCYKEMEIALRSIDVNEDREATMAWFLIRLNDEIAHIMELQHYVELEDVVHMVIKVERKLKLKKASKYNVGSSSQVGRKKKWVFKKKCSNYCCMAYKTKSKFCGFLPLDVPSLFAILKAARKLVRKNMKSAGVTLLYRLFFFFFTIMVSHTL